MASDDLDAKLADLEQGLEPTKPDLTLLGLDDDPPAKAAPEPEPVAETEPTSGTLVLRWKRSIVKRDEAGRIVAVVGDHTTRLVKRDDEGRIVEFIEEIEEEIPE